MAIALGILLLLSGIFPIWSLTSQEVGYFESLGIPIVPHLSDVGEVNVGINGDQTHTLRSNGIPDNAVTQFPNNPYTILKQTFSMRFPQNPTINDEPTCLPSSSIIGFAINGVAIFSPFDENGNDLNAGIEGGMCPGQPSIGGIYFYARSPFPCSSFVRGEPDKIYGVALDGFPIYGPGSDDNRITNAELDACHGKTVDGRYRYYVTDEWPYVLGCFRGTPVSVEGGDGMPSSTPPTAVCKFACNKETESDEVVCDDDFVVSATTTVAATTVAATTLPALVLGILDDEVAKFSSRDDQIEQNTMLKGYTEMKINIDDTFTLLSNGIPDHATASYPNDDNPYELQQQDFELTIPRYPVFTEEPYCLPSSGIIGFATNGVALFSPYDVNDQDVNINGTFDLCNGRTSPSGIYHYSQLPNKDCTYPNTNENEIYGISIDGFPIYGPGDPPVDNTDLDICHGRFVDGQYRYYMTKEFPYILGCFRGKPQNLKRAPPSVDISNCRFACNIDTTTPANEERYCENGSVSIFYYSVISSLLPVCMLFAFFL